jgi:type VI protein secretion system component VasF
MDELILRYLDRQATPQEEADLAVRLRADRDARRRFARISRLHGNLAGVLAEAAAPAPTLSDLSSELLIGALRLRTVQDPDRLRRSLEDRLRLIEHDDARYALAAFIGATDGKEFIARLDRLRAADDTDALEIYYLCLALGYVIPGREARMDDLLRDLHPKWRGLSPSWRPADRPRIAPWTPVAACALIVVALSALLSTLLTATTDSVIDKLK